VRKAALALLVALALLALVASGPGGHTPTAARATHALPPADPRGRFPRPRRVALLVLENRSYEQVIGSPRAPYLNHLARSGALETRDYALAHPSLPNYIALTGGHTYAIHNNCSGCDTEATNLVDQLNGAQISWRAYFQSLPSVGSRVIRRGDYSAHYNPFTYFERVRSSPLDRAKIRSFARLRHDIRARTLPRFSWISPDLAHDGHNDSLRSTDRFAARLIPHLVRALGRRGLLYVTWDEGLRRDHRGVHGSPGGGRIALIAAGARARRHTRSPRPTNHYALLRSLEAGFGLPALGRAGAPGTPLLTGLVSRPGGSPIRGPS
jgi:acid phosphatase